MFLLVMCLAIGAAGYALYTKDVDGQIQVSSLLASNAKQEYNALFEQIRHLDPQYFLSFPGGDLPENFDPNALITHVYRIKRGDTTPELYTNADVEEGAGRLVARVHDVLFGDKIFVTAELNGWT